MKNKRLILCIINIGLIIFICSCSGNSSSQLSILSRNSSSSQVKSSFKISMSSHPNSLSHSDSSLQTGSSSQTISSSQGNPILPIGKPSQLGMTSKAMEGMYNFYCFNGSIYRMVGSSEVSQYASIKPECVLVFDSSELSEKPIGSVNYPLAPDEKDTDSVYAIKGIPILKGVSMPKSIAIQMAQQYYCRADYFMSDRITYNNQQYLIVPVVLAGCEKPDSFLPYEVNKKVGTANGFEVYSLKNPQKPNELAVDIPGMTYGVGSGKLYPLAILNSVPVVNSSTVTK